MANYIVAYTIKSDSQKGTDFSDFLESIGIKDPVDQSTRYGCYAGDYRQLINRINTEIKKLNLSKEDTVMLFSAGKNNNLTINKNELI